jgi:hypothetical protein
MLPPLTDRAVGVLLSSILPVLIDYINKLPLISPSHHDHKHPSLSFLHRHPRLLNPLLCLHLKLSSKCPELTHPSSSNILLLVGGYTYSPPPQLKTTKAFQTPVVRVGKQVWLDNFPTIWELISFSETACKTNGVCILYCSKCVTFLSLRTHLYIYRK